MSIHFALTNVSQVTTNDDNISVGEAVKKSLSATQGFVQPLGAQNVNLTGANASSPNLSTIY